jgi:carbon storage regulator
MASNGATGHTSADAGVLSPDPRKWRKEASLMLVLTRKANQSIMIGDTIEVSVLSVLGEKVRLGIQAPRDVPVFRKEVFLEIQAQNLEAAESSKEALDQALGMMGDADDGSR